MIKKNYFNRGFFVATFSILSLFLLLVTHPLTIGHSGLAYTQDVANSNILYLPHVNHGQGWQTSISITNTECKSKHRWVDVTLTAYDKDGLSLGVVKDITRLRAYKTKTIDAQTLPPGTETLKVESDGNLVCNAIFKTTDGTKSEVVPAIKEPSKQLDFPALVSYDDLYIYKTITILNPNTTPASVDIIALDKDGYEIDRNVLSPLSSTESKTFSLVDIFDPRTLKDLSTVRVVSDSNIVGLQLVDYPEVDLVGLPALTITSKGWTFPIATKGENFELWTKVGVLNPGNDIASVTVEAFDASNNSLGIIHSQTILSGVTYVINTANLDTIEGDAIPLNTAILKVTSTQPVIGYEVIGVLNGSGLSAVMGIPDEDHTSVGFELIGSMDGGVLNAYSIVRMGDGSVKSTAGSLGSEEWWKKEMKLSMQGTRDIIQDQCLQESTIETTTSIPNTPCNLTATILDNTSIALYWHDNSTVENGFKIERESGNENWVQIGTTSLNNSRFYNNYYVDSKLDNNNNTYYYRIRAYNDNGNSNYSNETFAVSIQTSDGFDFPVGDVNGDGPYARDDNGQLCTSKYDGHDGHDGHNWYVSADVMDPDYLKKDGKLQQHTGEDWNGACGLETDRYQPVYATSLGRVVYAGKVPTVWGNTVLIAHKLPIGEIVYTQYAHLEKIDVSPGDQVKRRQQIGSIGKMAIDKPCNSDGTGNCAHLHFEVRRSPVSVGNWPNDPEVIKKQYYDPTDRKRDNDNGWNQAGFVDTHRNLDGTDNPPSISITSPNNGATISGVVTVTADATDDKGIAKVEFYLDDIFKSTDTSFPYSWLWDTTQSNNGSHTIKAIAYDTANQTATSQIIVTVSNTITSIDVTYFKINNDASSTTSRKVTLNNTAIGDPTQYMASESSTFSGASWQAYSTAPSFTLSSVNGNKTVYFKVKNSTSESAVVSDGIMLNVPPLQPDLKLPLPGNKSWLLTVEAGGKDFWGGIDVYHTGNGYYSLDFDDITKEVGSLVDVSILAAGDGQVIEADWSSGGFGYTVLIDHDEPYDGNGYTTRYGHLKETPPVSNGQKVKQGDIIGIMGSTGNSTGTHIHFQVYYNKSSASTVKELQGIIIDGTKIEDYKVGTQNPWNPKYYLSTNGATGTPMVTYFKINNDASSTNSRKVTLNNTATGSPTHYMASESSTFSSAIWQAYSPAPGFTLSSGNGNKTVYFKVKNSTSESAVVNDSITLIETTVTVTFPNGGESWQAGSTQAIKWSYTGDPGPSVKIELLKGTSVNSTIMSSTSIGSNGSGSYNWTIPTTQTTGSDYKVRITSTSNSAYTDTSDNNFTIIDSTLEAPTLLSATPKCDGTNPGIELQWTAVSGATNYEIYRNEVLIYTTLTSGTTFWNVGLTTGQSYTYKVKAKNSSTTSNFSNSLTAIAPNCVILEAPTLLSATPKCDGTNP
ncbi:MAG: peptidoglycan DD-metalloendopeptidase family protein, partial [Candidatus Brocadiales bacterium]|nr:peptidoglycan DD-metalloendopeptidase family protein [Candidatus Brocadiales bacterium]